MFFENGIVNFNAGSYDKAFESFTEALKLNHGHIEAMEKRAEIHFKRDEFEECVIECEEILKKKPSSDIKTLKLKAEKSVPSEEPWWQVLNVASNATKDQVKKAFNKLVKIFHPDRNKKNTLESDMKKSTARMAKINSANVKFKNKTKN